MDHPSDITAEEFAKAVSNALSKFNRISMRMGDRDPNLLKLLIKEELIYNRVINDYKKGGYVNVY